LLVHARSRRTMLVVGGTYVVCSGLLYFLFMAAWLNLFLLAGQMAAVTTVAGGIALLVAILNIKDYFFFHQGPTLSIPETAKPRLFERMRHLLQATRLAPVLAGTVVLALAANSYELLCTAGFPMVYTRVLTLEEPSAAARYVYLAFYNLIYVTPLAVIVALFVRTLGARRLTEREGRLLKLLSGLMMLGLGLVLLVEPGLTGNAFVGLGLIAAAVAVTWIAARLTRGKPSGA
ncbi:MAG TPA: hypothetical protein VF859_01890, partial [Burkholderiales bacterium]